MEFSPTLINQHFEQRSLEERVEFEISELEVLFDVPKKRPDLEAVLGFALIFCHSIQKFHYHSSDYQLKKVIMKFLILLLSFGSVFPLSISQKYKLKKGLQGTEMFQNLKMFVQKQSI